MSENAKKTSVFAETLALVSEVKDALLKNTDNAFKTNSLREEIERVLNEQVTVNEAEEDGEDITVGSTEDMGGELTTDTPDLDTSEVGDGEPESAEVTDIEGDIETDGAAIEEPEVMDLTNSSDEEALEVFKKLSAEDEIEVVQKDNGEIEIKTQDGGEFIAKPDSGEAAIEEPADDMVSADGEISPEAGTDLDAAIGDAADDAVSDASDDAVSDTVSGDTMGDDSEMSDEPAGDDDEEEIVFEFDLNEPSMAEKTVAEKTVAEETVAEKNVAEKKVTESDNWEVKYKELNETHSKVVNELKSFRGKYTKMVQEQKQLTNKVSVLKESVDLYKVNEKEYKQAVAKLKSTLNEVAVYTANTTNILNLMMENSTTKEEKARILSSFNNVTTVSESEKVYNTLNESFKSINKKTAEQILSESTRSQQSGSSQTTELKEKTLFKDKKLNEHLEQMKKIIKH